MNSKFKNFINKILKKVSNETDNMLAFGELKSTLVNAVEISNILLEKVINDIFLPITDDLNCIVELHKDNMELDAKILVDGKVVYFNINEVFDEELYGFFSKNYGEFEKYLEYSGYLYAILKCDYRIYNKYDYDDLKDLGFDLKNAMLFREFLETLNELYSITVEDNNSKLNITYKGLFDINFSFDSEQKKYKLDNKSINISDSLKFLETDGLNFKKSQIATGKIYDFVDDYHPVYVKLKKLVDDYMYILLESDDYSLQNEFKTSRPKASNDIFFEGCHINKLFLNKDMVKYYDLSNVDFDGKDISGLDVRCNPEVKINFNKIVKDLSDSNLKGYNLNKYKFVGFNLTNTNLCNTGATIDLATCNISGESKMGSGTMFDTDNKFVFLDKKLTHNDVEKLGIKIYKKTI